MNGRLELTSEKISSWKAALGRLKAKCIPSAMYGRAILPYAMHADVAIHDNLNRVALYPADSQSAHLFALNAA